MSAQTALPNTKMKNERTKRNIMKQLTGFLFVMPASVFTLVFFILPLIMTIYMSLHDWPLIGESSFTGFENYIELMDDEQFLDSLIFTTRYTLIITPMIFITAFILALLVDLPLRGVGFYRTAYFLPVVIGLGTSSLLWVWLLNDRVGLFNAVLKELGIITRSIIWLSDPNWVMPMINISIVWKTVGFSMILLLTGMQAISSDLYEAAKVDGAGYLDRIRYIMMPLLRRTFALALVISVIGSYLAFDQFFIMTRGGPMNSTITVVYWIYTNSFTYFKLGYGAAMSVILLIILALLSVVQLWLLRDDTEF